MVLKIAFLFFKYLKPCRKWFSLSFCWCRYAIRCLPTYHYFSSSDDLILIYCVIGISRQVGTLRYTSWNCLRVSVFSVWKPFLGRDSWTPFKYKHGSPHKKKNQ